MTQSYRDLVLYRDAEGSAVLHRVMKVDKKNRTCQMRGDGNVCLEPPLPFESICGTGIEIIKDGKKISVRNLIYNIKFRRVHHWRNKQERHKKKAAE